MCVCIGDGVVYFYFLPIYMYVILSVYIPMFMCEDRLLCYGLCGNQNNVRCHSSFSTLFVVANPHCFPFYHNHSRITNVPFHTLLLSLPPSLPSYETRFHITLAGLKLYVDQASFKLSEKVHQYS